jgi:hypothetical protein
LTEVCELPRDRRDALVKDIKGDAVGLRQDDSGLLGITKALIGEGAPFLLTWKPPSMITAQLIRIPCGCATDPCP